jgi:hypothetical protein
MLAQRMQRRNRSDTKWECLCRSKVHTAAAHRRNITPLDGVIGREGHCAQPAAFTIKGCFAGAGVCDLFIACVWVVILPSNRLPETLNQPVMRTDIAQPIRLKDYRPPDWLVETVSLDVSLHPTQTKVRATLRLKPNPKTPAAPLVLDGDGLSLVSLKLNGSDPGPDSYVATPDQLTIPQPPQGPFTLEIETAVDPSTRSFPASTAPAAPIAPNARPKAFVALLIFRTGRT